MLTGLANHATKSVTLETHAVFQLAQDGDGLMSHAEFLRPNARPLHLAECGTHVFSLHSRVLRAEPVSQQFSVDTAALSHPLQNPLLASMTSLPAKAPSGYWRVRRASKRWRRLAGGGKVLAHYSLFS